MTTSGITVDHSKPVQFLPGERGVPVNFGGRTVTVVFKDRDYEKLTSMAQTIRSKRPDYTNDDAIVWATRRAIDDGLLIDSVVRIGRHHVG